jgi:hypothetical protein
MAIDKVGAVGGAGATPALEPLGKARFSEVLEGVKGPAKHPGPQVASEGSPRPAPAGTAEVQAGARVESVRSARSQQAVRMLDRVSEAQQRLERILELACSGKTFTPNELIALQAHVYQASQELDLVGKVVEKATGGVKQVLQTQV